MRQGVRFILAGIICCLLGMSSWGQVKAPRFRALVIYENGGNHVKYSAVAKPWLDKLAADSNFAVDYITNANPITEESLAQYQLFIQLDYPPYTWPPKAVEAFQRYIDEGKGGWIGFHHATLLGEFDGYNIWPWFSRFMGDIRFKNYIPGFAAGEVSVEDSAHPVLKGVPRKFTIQKEEWYTWNKSPRPNVRVLASVDERTYHPASTTTMGDHPVIWSNPNVRARNVYIFMGHGPDLFENTAYTTIFRNAVFWASGK